MRMLFVTANNNRKQLEALTNLLLAAFPGSVIYQHIDPLNAPKDVLHNQVDAVFAEMKMEKMSGIELLHILHQKNPELPIFLLSDEEDEAGYAVKNGAVACLIRPLSAEKLRESLNGIL